MAHLLRRAGFGATKDELEQYVAKGYEANVEELLHPELAPLLEEDVIRRYHVDQNSLMFIESCQAYWMYRMINTKRPLEEKVALSRAFEDRVVPGFEDGSLQVVVDRRYRLADIAEAHAYMETNASVGKIALDVATD